VSDPEPLTFDGLIATLREWAGRPAVVTCGPAPSVHPPGRGLVWMHVRGRLHTSEAGEFWGSVGNGKPAREAIAFQVGDDPESYVVFYRELFTHGYWVSREHGFFIAEMGSISVGVSVAPGDVGAAT
jgi:hypothetical protein